MICATSRDTRSRNEPQRVSTRRRGSNWLKVTSELNVLSTLRRRSPLSSGSDGVNCTSNTHAHFLGHRDRSTPVSRRRQWRRRRRHPLKRDRTSIDPEKPLPRAREREYWPWASRRSSRARADARRGWECRRRGRRHRCRRRAAARSSRFRSSWRREELQPGRGTGGGGRCNPRDGPVQRLHRPLVRVKEKRSHVRTEEAIAART